MHLRIPLALFPVVLGCATTSGQQATSAPSPAPLPAAAGDTSPSHAGGPDTSKKGAASDTAKIKPYAKVIPASATTQHGLFTTHVVDDKLYFEIPRAAMDRDMLLLGRYAHGGAGSQSGLGGERFASRTLRWERHGHRVVLRSPSYILFADSSLPVYKAVVAASEAPIIAIFPIEAFGADSAPVVDVSRLYTTAIPEFQAGRGQLDEKRSYVERVLAFPENIEVEAAQTITPPSEGPASPLAPPPLAHSVVAHWSMVLLPEHPMVPRRADPRVGFIPIEQKIDVGTNEQRAATRSYIARFRLEKKDPAAAISDPVKPIIYYIDPAIPDQLKPYVRKAVLEWQPAFTAAGFSNAIIPMDPPANDSTWSLEDARYTVVHWLPTTTENAYAEVTGLQDPRTGETLNGSVFIFHNVMQLVHDWYFSQVAPLDPRALSTPFPDSLMGTLIQYVVAHEIGHAIGLYHDQLGSSLYPVDSVRSKTWVAKMGHTPSIMDYSRFNYVAQPEDSIPVADLVPHVGPYDIFAIRWGYTPIPDAKNADEERPTLDRWAMIQDTVPWLRFEAEGTAGTAAGYTEAVGDADAVRATGWGLKNLRRVMPLIPRAALRPGEDNTELADLYSGNAGVIAQWQLEMHHVVEVVGGSTVQVKSGSQPGPSFTPRSHASEVAAVTFLNANAFQTPTFLIDNAITSRLETNGTLNRINGAQSGILSALLENARMTRLIDFEARAARSGDAYPLADMLEAVRHGIWSELAASRVTIDPYRRALQSSYLSQVAAKINPPTDKGASPRGRAVGESETPSDVVAVLRGGLVTLRTEIRAALPRTADSMTRLHLEAAASRIGEILEPKR